LVGFCGQQEEADWAPVISGKKQKASEKKTRMRRFIPEQVKFQIRGESGTLAL
jgi:hypothetical protein